MCAFCEIIPPSLVCEDESSNARMTMQQHYQNNYQVSGDLNRLPCPGHDGVTSRNERDTDSHHHDCTELFEEKQRFCCNACDSLASGHVTSDDNEGVTACDFYPIHQGLFFRSLNVFVVSRS